MAHPFFDAVAFPWDRPEARALWMALRKSVFDTGKILRACQDAGGDPSTIKPGAADMMWRDVIDHLQFSGRLRVLCDLLLRDNAFASVHTTVRAVLDAPDEPDASAARPPVGDPANTLPPADPPAAPVDVRRQRATQVLSAYELRAEQYFIDREPVRNAIEPLSDSADPRKVLAVHGSMGAGRSWSAELIERFATELGDAFVLLDRNNAATVEMAAAHLCERFEIEVPPALSTDAAWLKTLYDALYAQAKKQKKTWWIVVDDLSESLGGLAPVDKGVELLAYTIAAQLRDPEPRKHFRVVLLALGASKRPTKIPPSSFAITSVAPLEEKDVRKAVEEILAARGVRAPEQELASIVRRVFDAQSAAEPDESPLERLQGALRSERSLKGAGR